MARSLTKLGGKPVETFFVKRWQELDGVRSVHSESEAKGFANIRSLNKGRFFTPAHNALPWLQRDILRHAVPTSPYPGVLDLIPLII